MSMIPEVKCHRCGASFPATKSRCPACGTRRVAQSGRTPATTASGVKGTAAYERNETNTKWQMIFGLILVVAVILAVIVMVSTSLNGSAPGNSKPSAPVNSVDVSDETMDIETPPPATPTPTPTIESVTIYYYEKKLDSGDNAPTMHLGDAPLPLKAVVYPLGIEGATVTWSSGDDSVLKVTPTDDGGCTVEIIGTKAGGVKIYAECFGVKGECLIYCVD